MRTMTQLFSGSLLILTLAACGGTPTDGRATLMAACDTQQGIGWLKREHGEQYCECWADKAREVLADENYGKLVAAAAAELKAADNADREKIVRENTSLYSTVSNAARSCKAKG